MSDGSPDDDGREHAVTLELCRLLRMSTRFARSLTLRFAERSATNAFRERAELVDAVAATRDWRIVPFPPLPPAPLQGFPQEELKPDLMIAGIGQGKRWLFQLLVEVKLSTPLEQLWIAGRRVALPAAYAAVWSQIRTRDSADLRYVGTLSPGDQPTWRDDVETLAPAQVRATRDVWWAPELELSARQALREMSEGERVRFLPELRHLEASLQAAAPDLGIRPAGGPPLLHGLALRRVGRRRARAAARTR